MLSFFELHLHFKKTFKKPNILLNLQNIKFLLLIVIAIYYRDKK